MKGTIQTKIYSKLIHSWFLKREWLQYLWKFQPSHNIDDFLLVGEDIAFSTMLQQQGINTYVPPHPQDDLEMFGSIPHKALTYGVDMVAAKAIQTSFFQKPFVIFV